MTDIAAVQSVSTAAAGTSGSRDAALSRVSAAPPASTAARSTAAGQPLGAPARDGFVSSAELDEEEEGGRQTPPVGEGASPELEATAAGQEKKRSESSKDADKAEEPATAEEERRKELERKLEEVDKKIDDTEKQMRAAVDRGDQDEAERLGQQLGDFLKERQGLQRELEGGEAPAAQPVPSASAGPASSGGGAPAAGPLAGGTPGGGGGMPMGAGSPGAGGFPPGMMQGGAANPAGVSASSAEPMPPLNLQGNDRKTADFINKYLEKNGSPAAGQQAGELMVAYGRQNKVDPLILLAIAKTETNFGKAGIGVNGMLGVGAYDSDPNNATRNPKFSGVANQIRIGAETFAKLRAKGGSNEQAPISQQTAAVNRAGWASAQHWHSTVDSVYARISRDAQEMMG